MAEWELCIEKVPKRSGDKGARPMCLKVTMLEDFYIDFDRKTSNTEA